MDNLKNIDEIELKAIYTYLHDSMKENRFHLTDRAKEVILSTLEVSLKLLQIPKRTIETLEVGDIVKYFYKQRDGYDIDSNNVYTNEVRKINGNIVAIGVIIEKPIDEILERIEIIQIIPHEFLEIWGEIND
jgi:hypothetical protein